ncbi:2729_t:CDS:2 [Scutellospora calospora]|uniref:2729_t:CDS:1 n=1 Tax=Scutellospora calospora TaxID=85575 RepID=A0ACA9KZB0_9GLOM|nr:2729_t:CDS:2 [Scutellospora calospora]
MNLIESELSLEISQKEYTNETNTYPQNSIIKYKGFGRSLIYRIISEGQYPSDNKLAYTKKPGQYKIPNNYKVETTYGKQIQKTILCSIKYHGQKPVFHIKYGENLAEQVESDKSATTAANAYQAVKSDKLPLAELNSDQKIVNNKGTKWNGALLFGLQLQQIKEVREARQIARGIKPYSLLSNSGQKNRSKKGASSFQNSFNETTKTVFHSDDHVVLHEMAFSINSNYYRFVYKNNNDLDNSKNFRLQAVVHAMDHEKFSRNAYRELARICHDLPREWAVSSMKQKITNEINNHIKTTLFNLNNLEPKILDNENNEEHITDYEIIETVTNSIGKGAYRSIKDILRYMIPIWLQKKILNLESPTIYIRISGDGRNVGRKVNHVMFTFCVLNDLNNVFKPENHHTLVIYPGIEKYEILETALVLLIKDLEEIRNEFYDNEGRKWAIKLYFSADWKMLALCLGHKAANSDYFCLWCDCCKKLNGDFEYDWTINKNINNITQNFSKTNGHAKKPLFSMIEIDHWIVDELHLLLRITDRLWNLVIAELKTTKQFDSKRKIIIDEMKRINVKFEFWQDISNNWNSTSLMGDDKLKVLRNFNISEIFPKDRAQIIQQLWDSFAQLYDTLKDSQITGAEFKQKAINWLKLFLTKSTGSFNSSTFIKGLYRPNDITPYIHVMVYHVGEFIDLHRKFGMVGFSCSAVEKKNHQQVSYFFRKTLKDGGSEGVKKSAILEILDHDNRNLYFYKNNVPIYFEKETRLTIK